MALDVKVPPLIAASFLAAFAGGTAAYDRGLPLLGLVAVVSAIVVAAAGTFDLSRLRPADDLVTSEQPPAAGPEPVRLDEGHAA
jgi:hypothetical protein